MSKKDHNIMGRDIPSAPPVKIMNSEIFQPRAPPPSYEESQKSSNFFRAPPPNYSSSTVAVASSGYSFRPTEYQRPITLYTPASSYGQNSMNVGVMVPALNQIDPTTPKVLEFDSGARFKGKGAGSITVPPPPPGYPPTPAQLAAMQGQPVILQKKKRSLF